MNTNTTSGQHHYTATLYLTLAIAIHVCVWAVNWVICAAVTESWLAPWDTAVWYPQPGSIEHSVNQFFETMPGAILPATAFVVFDVILLASCHQSGRAFVSVVLKSALLNFVCLIVLFLVGMVLHDISRTYLSRPEYTVDYGYHLTGASVAAFGIGIIALYWVKMARWRKAARSVVGQ